MRRRKLTQLDNDAIVRIGKENRRKKRFRLKDRILGNTPVSVAGVRLIEKKYGTKKARDIFYQAKKYHQLFAFGNNYVERVTPKKIERLLKSKLLFSYFSELYGADKKKMFADAIMSFCAANGICAPKKLHTDVVYIPRQFEKKQLSAQEIFEETEKNIVKNDARCAETFGTSSLYDNVIYDAPIAERAASKKMPEIEGVSFPVIVETTTNYQIWDIEKGKIKKIIIRGEK